MNIQEFLMGLLYLVITLAGMAIVGKVLQFVNAKIDKLQAETKLNQYTKLNKYIDMAQSAISIAVQTVSQTFVDDLKAEGKFDGEAKSKAKNDCLELCKAMMSEDVKKAIVEVFGDLEVYLCSTIEAVVKASK